MHKHHVLICIMIHIDSCMKATSKQQARPIARQNAAFHNHKYNGFICTGALRKVLYNGYVGLQIGLWGDPEQLVQLHAQLCGTAGSRVDQGRFLRVGSSSTG